MIHIILIITMIVGILLILISLKSFKKEEYIPTSNYLEIENTLRAVNSSVEDADNAITQINKLSKSVFDEFEEKYQELMFLYSLIDEKKKEIAEIYNKPMPAVVSYEEAPVKATRSRAQVVKNPHFNEIMQLYNEGTSISEISKRLGIGQGEVKLILELGKG